MDVHRAHTTSEVRQELVKYRTNVIAIPPGMTSLLQPCDVSLNKSFKAKMRMHWKDWFMNGVNDQTPAGNRRKASYSMVCDWVSKSWHDIDQTMIVHSFITTGISANMDKLELVVHEPLRRLLSGLNPEFKIPSAKEKHLLCELDETEDEFKDALLQEVNNNQHLSNFVSSDSENELEHAIFVEDSVSET